MRVARLERQAGSKQAGRISKKCVIEEMYREGIEGGKGQAVLVCDGVRIGITFDTLGYSGITGSDRYLESTGALAVLGSLKKEYRNPKPSIKEYIAEAIGISGEEGMTLDQCVKLSEM